MGTYVCVCGCVCMCVYSGITRERVEQSKPNLVHVRREKSKVTVYKIFETTNKPLFLPLGEILSFAEQYWNFQKQTASL